MSALETNTGFPGGAVVEDLPANAGDTRLAGFIPGLGRPPGVGNATHSSILAWRIPWTEEPGRLQSMGSLRVGTRLSDFTFTFPFHALEKELATHSSVLAWRIPGMAEPGGLQSGGSQSQTQPNDRTQQCSTGS